MSVSGNSPRRSNGDAFSRLEAAVTRVVAHVEDVESRLGLAEKRAEDLDALLGRMSSGELQPSQVLRRLEILERENADMRRRLAQGREGVEKLLAQVRFLEEQR